MVQQVLDRGEACMCMGDFNRPLQAKKPTLGTRLLKDWIEDGTMKLINNTNIMTRIDPGSGNGSVLDLAIVSANIKESVTQLTVDNQRNKNKTVEKNLQIILRSV